MCVPHPDGQYADQARRLRAVRAHYGMNSTEFAARAGIAFASYSQYEGGKHRVSIPNAIRLREVYGITLDFLYVGSIDTLPMNLARAMSSSPLLTNSKTSTDSPD